MLPRFGFLSPFSSSSQFTAVFLGVTLAALSPLSTAYGQCPITDPDCRGGNCTAVGDGASAESGQSVTINVASNDTGGSSCSVSIASGPAHGTAFATFGGKVTYTANPGYTGTDSFTYSYGNSTATVIITVVAPNDPPNASNDTYGTREGGTVSGNVLTNDDDPDGDHLSARLVGGVGSGTLDLDGDGSFHFDTAGDFNGLGDSDRRSVSFAYEARDGNGGTDRATVTIDVDGRNDPPSARPVSFSVQEGKGNGISARVSDPDNSTLSISVQQPSKGVADGGAGTVSFDPNGAFDALRGGATEEVRFPYRVSDGDGGSDQATATVTVTGRNDRPTAEAVSPSTPEDTPVTIDLSSAVGDAEDRDGELSVSVQSGPSNGSVSNASPNPLELTYEPKTNYYGNDSFTYAVTDSDGSTETATVDVSVSPIPDVALAGGGAAFNPTVGDRDLLEGLPAGALRLRSTDTENGFLDGFTLTNSHPGIGGVEELAVYRSPDKILDASDARIAVSTVGSTLPETIPVSFANKVPLQTQNQYLFVTVVTTPDAPEKALELTLQAAAALSFDGAGAVSGKTSFPIPLWDESVTLPVELAQFEGRSAEGGIALRWRTASEHNNAAFQVQRAVPGSSGWTTVGRREGAGTTDQPQTYRFTDEHLPYEADSVRYRLRQLDTDGRTHLSDPIVVGRGGVQALQLKGTFPNPATEQVTVRYAVPGSATGKTRLALYDVLGREVRTVAVGAADGRIEKRLDLSGLSSGLYVLRLRAGSAVETRRLTVTQ